MCPLPSSAESTRPVRKRRAPKLLDMEEPAETVRTKACTTTTTTTTPRVTHSRDPVAVPSAPLGTRSSTAAAAAAVGCSHLEQEQLLRQSSSLQAFDLVLHALGSLDAAGGPQEGSRRGVHLQLGRYEAAPAAAVALRGCQYGFGGWV